MLQHIYIYIQRRIDAGLAEPGPDLWRAAIFVKVRLKFIAVGNADAYIAFVYVLQSLCS